MSLPVRLTELGRIRIGDQVPAASGNPRAHKLTQFRMTGNNPLIMQAIAEAYGGEVQRWEVRPEWQALKGVRQPTHKWELYTETDTLDVIIPALSEVSTWREVWDAGGCAHRCDAETRQIALDDDEHAQGHICTREDCQEISRISIMLAGIKAFGTWRLDTKGYYASSEIRGFLQWMELCGIRFAIKAMLTLEERQTKSHAKGTLHFVVPVFQPDYSPDQLMLMAGQSQSAPLLPPPTDAQHAQNVIELFGETPTRDNGAPHAESPAAKDLWTDATFNAATKTLADACRAAGVDKASVWRQLQSEHGVTYLRDIPPDSLARCTADLQAQAAETPDATAAGDDIAF